MVAALGWGIAGCGWVVRDFVGPAIQRSANGKLVALYDPDPLSRNRARTLFGAPCFDKLEAFLGAEGCDAVQGYLIGKPLPIGQYAALVGRANSNVMEPARKTG